jgi:uncharacterized coiled-coil DUF342 family protein
MSEDKQYLNLSNQVHVLNTEISHLQAEVDKMQQNMSEQSEEIVEINKRIKTLKKSIKGLEDWIQDEEEAQRLEQRREFRKEMQSRSNWWSLGIAVISALLGSGATILAQWLL